MNNEPIGYIVGGGLKEGFRIRLTVPADRVQEGSFVVCENGRFRYYGLVTDLQLGATDPRFADEKTDRLQPIIQQALLGKTLYTTLNMYPTLMLDRGPEPGTRDRLEWEQRVDRGEENPGPRPVKTVPAHHADVRQADEADVAQIFGEDGKGMFVEEAEGKRCRLDYGVKWRPSIHMPRWASRITLRVTNVRVERVQEISEEDALAEGVYGDEAAPFDQATATMCFEALWDSINAKRGYGWDANPWVWVVEFERVEAAR